MSNSAIAAITGSGSSKTRMDTSSIESNSKTRQITEDREFVYGATSVDASGTGGDKRTRLPFVGEEESSTRHGGIARSRGESEAIPREVIGQVDKSQGVVRSISRPRELAGRSMVMVDPRKFSYNALRASSRFIPIEVTRDDRMSASEACAMLDRIHVEMGVHVVGQDPDELVLGGFDRGLWFCHTVNGSSVLNPGKATFQVPGLTVAFRYSDVLNIIGPNPRRFFRAYGEEIKEYNKEILARYDPASPVDMENWAWLMEVASNRGLARYPYLAHDSADGCLHLSHSERMAIANSKVSVLSRVVNAVDSFNTNSRVQTLEDPKLDKTT